ncbi:MAG: UDP-N-acetylmuramate--L-alanine ligase [Clostridia bacterium]|nr:UDP-N-acetylmuramate--L-alanine ligase [Clostridia bacterium]
MSMSALCRLCFEKGIRTSGYDATESEVTRSLSELGIPMYYGFSEEMYKSVTAVVYTAAIHADDPILAYPSSLGLPLISRADALGYLSLEKKHRIGVAGTHGKSTTTGMLTAIFLAAERDPMVLGGAGIPEIGGTLRLGEGDDLIFEACEYQDSFLHFSPTTAIVLDVEHDHVDYFPTEESIVKSFVRYADLVGDDGLAVINCDTKLAQTVSERATAKKLCVSQSGDADYCAKNVKIERGFATFDTHYQGKKLFTATLGVPGTFQIGNALCAIAAARACGVADEAIVKGLASFHGVERRFQMRGTLNNVPVVDDYAHHPTEISATLSAANECGYKNIVCVFQPHTFTRTEAFWEEFTSVFSPCREVIFADIYPAREEPIEGINAENLARDAKNGRYCGDFAAIADYLKADQNADLYLIMGAGSIIALTDLILEERGE